MLKIKKNIPSHTLRTLSYSPSQHYFCTKFNNSSLFILLTKPLAVYTIPLNLRLSISQYGTSKGFIGTVAATYISDILPGQERSGVLSLVHRSCLWNTSSLSVSSGAIFCTRDFLGCLPHMGVGPNFFSHSHNIKSNTA